MHRYTVYHHVFRIVSEFVTLPIRPKVFPRLYIRAGEVFYRFLFESGSGGILKSLKSLVPGSAIFFGEDCPP